MSEGFTPAVVEDKQTIKPWIYWYDWRPGDGTTLRPADDLYDGDPNCKHMAYAKWQGGVKCAYCPAWFCY